MTDFAVAVMVSLIFCVGFAYGWAFGASPSAWWTDFPLVVFGLGTMLFLARRYGRRPPPGAERQK